MNGDWVLLAIIVALAALVAILVYELMRQARAATEHQQELFELVSQQSALIASSDALTYQALRAADAFSGYDGASSPALTEEDGDGDGSDGASEHIESGDPFIDGKLFSNN